MTADADKPPFLPFALPEIGDEEIAEVVDTLKSGWVTTGPKTARFEREFSAFLGDEALHSIAVNSATAGLHLALEALGIGPGDEVITTTHTFTATAEVVRYLGADVKLVDIDPVTLNIDPDAIRVAVRDEIILNPDREMEPGAQEVTGLTREFLSDKPRFPQVVDEFLEFIRGAELIIHNAEFDVGFLDNELAMATPATCTATTASISLAAVRLAPSSVQAISRAPACEQLGPPRRAWCAQTKPLWGLSQRW